MTVTLTLDGGTEAKCVMLAVSNVGEHECIAFLPMEGADSEEGEVYLYCCNETEGGTPNLDNIEDDDEYEVVARVSDEFLDARKYNELTGEDEEE